MNKRIMVIWGMLVFIIFATILIIGFIKFNKNIVVKIEDLIDNNYIKENENIKKYCIKTITVYKGILLYEYKINKNCEEETINE